jgi:type I restriction enzyme S subunit
MPLLRITASNWESKHLFEVDDVDEERSENIPELRFPEFDKEWRKVLLADICVGIKSGKTDPNEGGDYPDLWLDFTRKIGYCAEPSHEGEFILVARVGANAGTKNYVLGEFGVTDNTLVIESKGDTNVCYSFLCIRYL